jgi:hypothetical protein
MDLLKEKFEVLKSAKLEKEEDYIKWSKYLNVLQKDVFNCIKKLKYKDKINYYVLNKTMLIWALENLKNQLKEQNILRFNKEIFIPNDFDISKYLHNLHKSISSRDFVLVEHLLDEYAIDSSTTPKDLKSYLDKQHYLFEILRDVTSNFLIKFYSVPISFEMAIRSTDKILKNVDYEI